MKKKSNNLQLIRFIAAVMVIVSHAFPLSGNSTGDVMFVFSGRTYHLGLFAVQIFFLFSGFLMARSLLNRKSVDTLSFLKGRLNRLVPPLATVTLCCMILGSLLSELQIKDYFTSAQTYKYLLNSIFILVHDLPGVFQNNVYDATVNGALWTMPVEFLCCVACYIIYRMNLLNGKRVLFLIPAVVAVYAFTKFYFPELFIDAPRAGAMFFIGMAYCVFWDKIKFTKLSIILSAAGFIVTLALRLPFVGVYLFMHYFLMGIAFYLPQCSEKISAIGDSSYCIYLWGWPVQQTVVYFFGGSMNAHINYIISIPIAILLGYITHKLVEEKCLQRKITAT